MNNCPEQTLPIHPEGSFENSKNLLGTRDRYTLVMFSTNFKPLATQLSLLGSTPFCQVGQTQYSEKKIIKVWTIWNCIYLGHFFHISDRSVKQR